MTILYSCVVDRHYLFQYQGWIWAHSLITNAHVHPQNIWMHCVNNVDRDFKNHCLDLGINIRDIKPFGDGKHCNKLAQLFNPALREGDILILMDTDTFILENFESKLSKNKIAGKAVDYPNPKISVFDELFPIAGLKKSIDDMKTSFDDACTYGGNFNGGLYIIPISCFDALYMSWPKWANWLLAHIKQEKRVVFPDVHIDQMSFCMSVHENEFPVQELELSFNFPLHVLDNAKEKPKVLHYHWKMNAIGLIDGVIDETLNSVIMKANDTIGNIFNNGIFWNYRYATNLALGSGVGSRGTDLEFKKIMLERLGIEKYATVLDIGFGDLEVVKGFNIQQYQGFDISNEAIRIAQSKRPDFKFDSINSLCFFADKKYDYVQCLDVLIHQKEHEDFARVLDCAIDKTSQRLIVSGFSQFDAACNTNPMLWFHKALKENLLDSKKFESIIRLFTIGCADYYVCDIKLNRTFWLDFFETSLKGELSTIIEKTVFLYVGKVKDREAFLQMFINENCHIIEMDEFLLPENVNIYKSQALLDSLRNDDWLSFIDFLKYLSLYDTTKIMFLTHDEHYNDALALSSVARLFIIALARVTNLKLLVS